MKGSGHGATTTVDMGRAFAIGGIVGLLIGVLFLLIPVLAVVLAVVATLLPPRPVVASGVLMGTGAGMATLLLVAGSRCAADATCTNTDLTGWFVLAAICIAVALLLAVVEMHRRSRVRT